MDKKALLLLAFVVVCIITVGCSSSQAATDVRATTIAAEVFATQTSQAFMPSITATPLVTLTPTITLTPSPTPTSMPTITKTPVPQPLIAFFEGEIESSGGEIYVSKLDGTGLKALLPKHGFLSGSSPAWSPDGTTIAFASNANRSVEGLLGDIWLISPDGSGLSGLLAK